MSESMDRRDEVLRRLLLEEADPLAAFDASELAGDDEARTELEDLLEAERRLAGLGADVRAPLRAPAPGSAEHAAEERVLAGVREKLGLRRPTRRGFGARMALLLAAGVALALGLRWFLGAREVEPDPGTSLGGTDSPVVVAPIDDVPSFGEFRWSGSAPDDGYFVVHVLDGTTGDEVAVSGRIGENRWSPTEAEWTLWPDEIRIYVEVFGPGLQDLRGRSREVRARRSP